MQVKKEEMKENMLMAANKVFMEVGYEKASIRKIVKEAGTTLGNFYNYFENKEMLFDALVFDEYNKFMYFIENHEEQIEDRPDELWDIDDVATWSTVLNDYMGSMIPVFSERFLLLIDKAEGTKYESFKIKVIDFFEEHYLDHINRFGNGMDTGYARTASTMFVDGLIDLVRKHMGEPTLKDLIIQHFVFFAIGSMGLIKYKGEVK